MIIIGLSLEEIWMEIVALAMRSMFTLFEWINSFFAHFWEAWLNTFDSFRYLLRVKHDHRDWANLICLIYLSRAGKTRVNHHKKSFNGWLRFNYIVQTSDGDVWWRVWDWNWQKQKHHTIVGSTMTTGRVHTHRLLKCLNSSLTAPLRPYHPML